MKKILITGSVLLLLLQSALAQTTERIQINAGNFLVLQREPIKDLINPFIRQIGAPYTHRFQSRFALRASFTRWFQLDEIGGNPF